MPVLRPLIPVALLALALGGCEETRKSIGWDKNPPDEFRIVTRAPLSVPPEFALRPPAPGAPRPQEGTTIDQARGAVTGGRAPARPAQPAAGPSAGSVVDAERETRRLRENQALGRPASEGDTPIVRRRQRGLLEGIF
jgi:hypothetical protein